MIHRPMRGDVWIANLDPVQGREQAKKRPCIILSANTFNQGSSDLVIAVPLTTKDRKNPWHISITPPEGGVVAESYALCEQIRVLSLNRLANHTIGKVSDQTLWAIEYTIKALLDFRT